MIRGARRYSLVADGGGARNIRMNANIGLGNQVATGFGAAAPQSLTGTPAIGKQTSSATNRQNWDRYERDLLDGFIQYESNAFTRKIQNDMYFSDPIISAAIDIGSNLPYSNFELSGTESKERRSYYTSSVNAMQIRSMLPKISREMKVEGKHISLMNFDDSKKRFTSIIPYAPHWCTVNPIPVFGRDPLIDVTYPPEIVKLMETTDDDMKRELEEYAEDLTELVKNKKTRLDPRMVLYIANTPFTWSPYGISALRKLIPIWLFEKSLARGTIDLAGRRQKSILHIIAGDDGWLPTNDQLKQLSDLFINADNDPIGAVVATRPGIDTNEVRSDTGSWGWTESYDTLTQIKLKGLGYSDAIFSDFNVQAAEQTINSTLETMQAEREDVTQRVFYRKMFPIIAIENNFMKSKKNLEITGSDKKMMERIQEYRDEYDYISKNSQHVLLGADSEVVDPDELDLPTIRYEKNLKVASSDTLFNNLGILAERGFPAPLRMQAAAIGVPFQDALDGLEQDVKDRKFIDEYRKKLPRDPSQDGGDEGADDGGDGNMFMESSDKWRRLIGSDVTARRPNRDMSSVVHKDTLTGKELSRRGRMHRMEGENKVIMEATNRIREQEAAKEKRSNRREKSYSYKKGK